MITNFYRANHKEIEEIYEDRYLIVYCTGLKSDGFKREYKALNSVFRRRISVDYGLEELLEYRYGMKFVISKEDGKDVIIPEQYPQLKLKIYDPCLCRIDFEDMLSRWYFEKTYYEKDMQIEYEYLIGEWAVANDYFCAIIKYNGKYELYAREISELIKAANSDPFFREHEGKLKCLFYKYGKQKGAYIFTFGNEADGGKGAFYEDSNNVLNVIENFF